MKHGPPGASKPCLLPAQFSRMRSRGPPGPASERAVLAPPDRLRPRGEHAELASLLRPGWGPAGSPDTY